MTVFRLGAPVLLIFCLFLSAPQIGATQDAPAQLEQLQQQNEQLHRQLRAARREIAQLKAEGAAPGWKDVATGLGIIFGLSGLAMMVNARRR